MANEMTPRGAATMIVATILIAASMFGPSTVKITERFDDAEKIIDEAEARYGKFPQDNS